MNTLKKALIKKTAETHLHVKHLAENARKLETELLQLNLQWPPRSV